MKKNTLNRQYYNKKSMQNMIVDYQYLMKKVSFFFSPQRGTKRIQGEVACVYRWILPEIVQANQVFPFLVCLRHEPILLNAIGKV